MRNRPRSKAVNKRYGGTSSVALTADQKEFLEAKAKELNEPVTRLTTIAIYNEFKKDKPFDFDFDMPEGEILEYSYASESNKIIKYMETKKAKSLSQLLLSHYEMGIDDLDSFKYAFMELLSKGTFICETITERKDNKGFLIGTVTYVLKAKCTKEKKVRATTKRIDRAVKTLDDLKKGKLK